MPTLRIQIQGVVWPQILAALAAGHDLPPDGNPSREWAEQIAAGLFAGHVAELMQPPRPVTRQVTRKQRIRPSRARI